MKNKLFILFLVLGVIPIILFFLHQIYILKDMGIITHDKLNKISLSSENSELKEIIVKDSTLYKKRTIFSGVLLGVLVLLGAIIISEIYGKKYNELNFIAADSFKEIAILKQKADSLSGLKSKNEELENNQGKLQESLLTLKESHNKYEKLFKELEENKNNAVLENKELLSKVNVYQSKIRDLESHAMSFDQKLKEAEKKISLSGSEKAKSEEVIKSAEKDFAQKTETMKSQIKALSDELAKEKNIKLSLQDSEKKLIEAMKSQIKVLSEELEKEKKMKLSIEQKLSDFERKIKEPQPAKQAVEPVKSKIEEKTLIKEPSAVESKSKTETVLPVKESALDVKEIKVKTEDKLPPKDISSAETKFKEEVKAEAKIEAKAETKTETKIEEKTSASVQPAVSASLNVPDGKIPKRSEASDDILVIDSSGTILNLFRNDLYRLGYTVHVARSSQDALRKAAITDYTFIILDAFIKDMPYDKLYEELSKINGNLTKRIMFFANENVTSNEREILIKKFKFLLDAKSTKEDLREIVYNLLEG